MRSVLKRLVMWADQKFLVNFKAKRVYTDNTNIIHILVATIDMIK